jgi:SAM-dependent methyltransferase
MPRKYQMNPQTGVYFAADTPSLPYSDGDAQEDRLLQFIRTSTDRSVASAELAAGIVDWPTYYHLSRRRCDLLRPVAELLRGDVLELGAGCGALTRYLGETARSVVAVEGSSRRAEIAAARCSGLSNVSVFRDGFEAFASDRKFDAVVCIGVFEYSPVFLSGSDPFRQMLSLAAGHLTPEGYLIIAIENRLGLKYFAGAPEDHSGIRFQGIEDLYERPGPRTIGRREWEKELTACRLEPAAFLYPFPDYKHPQALLGDAALADLDLDAAQLIRHLSAPNQDRDYPRLMSEELVWPVLARNGIAAEMANSLLIVARQIKAIRRRWSPSSLAYRYDSDRLPGYDKESRIARDSSGRLFVHRRRLHPDSATHASYRHHVADEVFPTGNSYLDGLYSIVNRSGWTIAGIAGWAQPWFQYLKSHADSDLSTLPREFVNCTPAHLTIATDGTLISSDLEFLAHVPLLLDFVLFHGLLDSFSKVRTCAAAELPTRNTCTDTAFGVMDILGLPLNPARREVVVRMEAEFQSSVWGRSLESSLAGIESARFSIREAAGSNLTSTADTFELQVFWRSEGEPFTEPCSCRVGSAGEPGIKHIRFQIPCCDPPPVEIRLDLSDRPGALSILDLRLLSSEGNLLWLWDHNPDAFTGCNEVLLLPSGLKPEVIAVMPSVDPFLLLPIPPDALTSLKNGGAIELDIRRDGLMGLLWMVAGAYDALRRTLSQASLI